MPSLVRKLLICAAVDGLLLHPAGARASDSSSSSVRIEYGTSKITASPARRQDDDSAPVLEAHGIIGLLNLVTSSYLVSITRREQVAQLRHHPVFAVRDVTLIPLASQAEAEKAIGHAQKVLGQGRFKIEAEQRLEGPEVSDAASVVSDVESVDDGGGGAGLGEAGQQQPELEAAALELPQNALKKSATGAKSPAAAQGSGIGRYALKWFQRGGGGGGEKTTGGEDARLTAEQEKQTVEALPREEGEALARGAAGEDEEEQSGGVHAAKQGKKTVIQALTPRILRSARLYFSTSGFFFSYEHDLSHTLAQQGPPGSEPPLWKRFDPLFFWNRHLIEPLIEAGQDSLALPVVQGFVGQRAFSITNTDEPGKAMVADALLEAEDVIQAPSDGGDESSQRRQEKEEKQTTSDFLLTLISRRSIKRAGLRYLRRGVDDEGYVANNVETEQILSSQSWSPNDRAFSLLQIRGSIPLFFSQSPYSFKPLPIMFGSQAANQNAIRKHFDWVMKRYGKVRVASLVDKHGTENGIGEAYEHHVKTLNETNGANGKIVDFEWFDFHSACKGMKFENVSILMNTLKDSLISFGWSIVQSDTETQLQTGILRTNCMDCLDRTNVVQSAVAGWALQQQLSSLGLPIDLQTDPKTQWFNTLWADNGDAISRQYAGTSALKGDFTRTRKRNWTGALSDFSLTLNRYYNNIFGDYFLQTCIDYYLGNAGPSVFEEFETDMMAQDSALDMRQVRQTAIDTCLKIVLEDPVEEPLIAGWTVSCPRDANTLRTLPFEECVLLLTANALYFCRFDWATEKVGGFERVDLADVTEVWRGAYVTSALGPAHLDEDKNVGFALRYRPDGSAVVRKNTRTFGFEEDVVAESQRDKTQARSAKAGGAKADNEESRLLAFKLLPPSAAAVRDSNLNLATTNEVDVVKHICEEIQKACAAAFQRERENRPLGLDRPLQVQQRDVISAAEAKKATRYVESIGYSLKKLVWS